VLDILSLLAGDFDDSWPIAAFEHHVLPEAAVIASHRAVEVDDVALATAEVLPQLGLRAVATHLKTSIG